MELSFLSEVMNNKDISIPEEVKRFFKKINISKVEVSQVQNTWEIYFFCQHLPSLKLLQNCSNNLARFLPEVDKIILKPKIQQHTTLQFFLEENWENILSFLMGKYPSTQGWMSNSYWKIINEDILEIYLGSALGVKYLTNKGCAKYLEELFTVFLDYSPRINLKWDKQILPVVLNKIEEKQNSEYIPLQLSGKQKNQPPKDNNKTNEILFGKKIKGEAKPIKEVVEEEHNVVVIGTPFSLDIRQLKTGRAILSFCVTDLTDSVTCKIIRELKEIEDIMAKITNSPRIKVKGTVQIDKFSQELTLMVNDINLLIAKGRTDTAKEKRVELHLHTKMSSMDGVSSAKDLIKIASGWGHEAIAITDHGVVQSFPEAYEAGEKYNIKIIYGIEAYIFDDSIKYQGKIPNYHCILLVKNKEGLKNLYNLVTESHLKFFSRVPRIPKSLLREKRTGILIGTACEAGELISKYLEVKNNFDILTEIAQFYDFIEVQPIGNNEFLIRNGTLNSDSELKKLNQDLYSLGLKMNIPVVATGDVHFANPEDEIFRRILMAGKGFSDADQQGPLYLKTTDEMLEEFSYLGEKEAKKVVVENPKYLVSQIEKIKPIPDEFFPPEISGAEDEIINLTYLTAKKMYGPNLPEIVEARIKKELDSIINNGFAVLYLIAHKLVKKSNDDGYLVGSRGSVGSSFVATLTGITEVNPIPPHYQCPRCFYSQFITDGSYGSGADLPDKSCPNCEYTLVKDGHDIPFEVFLGFKGDKVPDIDLNFSGEYQPRAHKYTEELFGKDNVFRAGTISTIANRTAFGFVKNYLDERQQIKRSAEINRLVEGCSGVKKTTGQHPGGLMVVPKSIDIHDFTPLQRPADDQNTETITTHFDYHSISSRLVKLDILGHDDPTVIKMLEDLTGVDARKIPLDDPQTMSLFSSPEALNIQPEELGSTVGTYGIPEFGTKFVRQMLEDTKPKTFSELVRISGFSHGTDVWLNNAQDLIKNSIAKLSEAISTRDDIMTFLILKGVDPSTAFKVMESVRKGNGVPVEYEAVMLAHNVPLWYIESCKKIKYMFPKAHAVAYVMMAFRIAYFKVNYPQAFYATFFSVRADEFDAQVISGGIYEVKRMLTSIKEKGNSATAKEIKLLIILELALEMYLRGFTFTRVDLKKSNAQKFIISNNSLIPPFVALQGVGITAGENIIKAREEYFFTSIEDLRIRAKLSKTVIETLQDHGCLSELPETDQLALFS
ncbi:MAG: DNA polymerase III subunit alpha [Clostridiaceae bacterium BRH_c20a]|nr:MAG: DNA polymerase III subunit alpha [Clostridiaceae bacterium BRH_c20a]